MSSNLDIKKEHTFLWKIEDLKLCTKVKGEWILSPSFRAKSLNDTSWCMRLYPRGSIDSKEGYMGCYLERCEIDNGGFEIECDFEISIISSDGKILISNKSSRIFPKNKCWGWPNFWKMSMQSSDINDVLLIRCNLISNAQKNILRSESSGVTSFDSDQSSFRWIVKKLNSDCSEIRKLPCTGKSHFEISVEVLDDDIKIKISRSESDNEAKCVMCQVTLLDVKGGERDSRQALHLFETKDTSNENPSFEFPTFLKKSKLNAEKEKYLKDDSFALKCKIVISNGTQTDTVEDKECDLSVADLSPPDTGTITVLEDYKRLYKVKIHADVKLLVDSQIIPAHKSILSIRSPVFKAMFGTEMVENETGTVTIPDLDAETMNSLLEYIYIGSVEKLDYEIASNLIVAADKYSVFTLKEKCAHFLKSVLSLSNVCEVLIIADLIQHDVLKVAIIDYIKDNSGCIFISEEWNSLVKNNFQLATDTFCQVAKLMSVNRQN